MTINEYISIFFFAEFTKLVNIYIVFTTTIKSNECNSKQNKVNNVQIIQISFRFSFSVQLKFSTTSIEVHFQLSSATVLFQFQYSSSSALLQ